MVYNSLCVYLNHDWRIEPGHSDNTPDNISRDAECKCHVSTELEHPDNIRDSIITPDSNCKCHN